MAYSRPAAVAMLAVASFCGNGSCDPTGIKCGEDVYVHCHIHSKNFYDKHAKTTKSLFNIKKDDKGNAIKVNVEDGKSVEICHPDGFKMPKPNAKGGYTGELIDVPGGLDWLKTDYQAKPLTLTCKNDKYEVSSPFAAKSNQPHEFVVPDKAQPNTSNKLKPDLTSGEFKSCIQDNGSKVGDDYHTKYYVSLFKQANSSWTNVSYYKDDNAIQSQDAAGTVRGHNQEK